MVVIKGNGAIKVNGRYIHYTSGLPAPIPEEIAKRIGKPYEVVGKPVIESVKAVVTKDEVYPVHEGAGWYLLSNGEKVRGKKEALKAEKEIES